MLSLTRKTDYALVALSYLGTRRRDAAGPVCAREVADRFELPSALLMNVLKELSTAGMLTSTRGSNGGYELALEPNRVSLLDVVIAIEGPVRITACCSAESTDSSEAATLATDAPDRGEACSLEDRCPIREPIHRLHERIHRFLAQVTLADLLGDVQSSACCGGSTVNPDHDPASLATMPVLDGEVSTCCKGM